MIISSTWQFWAGLGISLVCLVLALDEIDFGSVAAALGQVNVWLLLGLAVFSGLATFWFKSVCWKMIFHASNRPTVKGAFTTQFIGVLLNLCNVGFGTA